MITIPEMSYARSFERLSKILNELREKCPWDKKQTIHSLKEQSIEELYELTDAVSNENWLGIQEELGDLLLHVFFYSKIAEEQGRFNIGMVIEGICNKLVMRHPHIYSNTSVENEEEVKRNWEQLKLKEGKRSVLSGVPDSLPAMNKSLSIQRKVKQVGFEWENVQDVKNKVMEEWGELEDAIDGADSGSVEEEYGDLLFSLINYARFLKIDPVGALDKANKKFKFRFEQLELMAASENKALNEMTLSEMDTLWEKVKKGGS